ncbi:MAG: ABC transporter substrate-binding protein [Albidovulum sp.]|nr:ABC transporter substrate-binding protein [Albidovulum sp.]
MARANGTVIAMERVEFLSQDRVTDDSSILTLKNWVCEPLLRWRSGRVFPSLLEKWQLSPDGLCWQFQIRPGATFHDGTPCTSACIAGFIDNILNSVDMFGMKWSYARYLDGAAIETPASDILQVRTASPFPDLVDIFAEFHVSALDKSGLPTLGTGAWKVVEYEPGVRARLAPASGTGKRADFLSMRRAEDRLAALRDGAVNCSMQLEKLSVPRRSLEGFNWVESDANLTVTAFMNGRTGPFAWPEARLAANLAIDRDALVSGVMGGLASPATTVVSPFHLGYAEAGPAPIAHDPARARTILLESGAPAEVVLRSPEFMPERAPEIANFIAEALGEIGFHVDVQIEPDRPEYARQLGRKEMGDLAIFDSSPRSTFRVLDDKISSETASVWWQGVDDPRANDLFNSARRTLDPGMRAQAYGECLAHLSRHPHWLYLFYPKVCMAHATELKGLSLDHSGTLHVC